MAKKRRRRVRKNDASLKDFFIPGPNNVYRPLFLQIESAIVTAIVILVLFALALGVEKLVIQSPSPQVGAVVAAVLVDLANDDRAKEGVPHLAISPRLQEAAQMKADDMAAREYFAHDTPEGDEPWLWFERVGYDFRYAGENLAVYFADSMEVERAWMASPLHRANILNERFSEVGIGIAHGRYEGHDTTFVVQMFGARAEAGVAAAAVVGSSAPESDLSAVVAGASAEAQPIGAISSRSGSPLWRLLTAPRTALQWSYMAIAALVLLALSFLFLFELRRFHVPSFLRGVSLLALIALLLWSGTAYFSGDLLIL